MSSSKTLCSDRTFSLGELYQRYNSDLRRVVLRQLHDGDEAQDIVQDTFLAYIVCQTSLGRAASPRAMLLRIARNKMVDRMRHRSRRSIRAPPLGTEDEEASLHRLEAAAAREEDVDAVAARHDLAVLTRGESAEDLEVAHRHYVEGQSLTEIGQELKRTRKDLARCLRRLIERAHERDRCG